jgi:hypothetical protein
MQRKQLTDDVIAALAPKRKRQLYYHAEVRSLAVSVSPKGKKACVVVYHSPSARASAQGRHAQRWGQTRRV